MRFSGRNSRPGTIGGSAAHADPAADYPAAVQALEGQLVLSKKGGTRTVTAADFFVDTLTTALEHRGRHPEPA